MKTLREELSFDAAGVVLEHSENEKGGKDLYMKGICIQGEVRNQNERIYPVSEIKKAVSTLKEQLSGGYSVLGEIDHPDDLNVNLDRVSHMITDIWMSGNDGHGKLKILPTPSGQIIKAMLEAGVKLGVSSRGRGDIDSMTGKVSQFEIVTIDIVAQPSAQGAYPIAIYEGLENFNKGLKLLGIAEDACHDQRVQKYLKKGVLDFIKDLKIK